MRTWLRRGAWTGLALAAVGALAAWACDAGIRRAARDRCFDAPDRTPTNRVGLVLGTCPRIADGRDNLFYLHRLDTAAALYRAGRVEVLLVSGDNGRRGCDEPTAMRDDLVARGVPPERIYRDYAGFRTLDSVVRARWVFGLDRVTIVSQRFHNERALWLARRAGLDAIACDAPDVRGAFGLKVRAREALARVAAVLDATVLSRQPRFLGPPVVIGRDPPT